MMSAMVCGLVISSTSIAPEPNVLVEIPTDRPAALKQALSPRFGPHSIAAGEDHIQVILSEEELQLVRSEGFEATVIDIGRPLKHYNDRLRKEARDRGEEGVPTGYPDLSGIYQRMQDAASRRPDICRFVDLTATYNTPPTVQGRHLFAVKISDNVTRDEVEHPVLIVSCHHAREINTPIATLEAIDRLVDGYGTDPAITAAVDSWEIWIAPMWNPDGYNHVFNVDDFWRKNRRNNGDGTFGVDLNRNYPVGWSVCGSSSSTSSSTYQGTAAASEPPTLTMEAFAADRRFAKVGDIHSFASEVRYGYGCWFHPWDNSFQQTAAQLSHASGYAGSTRSSCCLGGDIHMHTARNGSLAFLWEIGTSFGPSYTSALNEADQLWPGFFSLITRTVPLSGRVTDASTGDALAAEIEFLNVGFANGEQHGSSGRTGLFHAHPPAGTYQLRFSAPGYQPADLEVTVDPEFSPVLNVQLAPDFIPCAADVNADGGATPADFTAWLACFSDPASAPFCDNADVNADGTISPADFTAWLAAFNDGCM